MGSECLAEQNAYCESNLAADNRTDSAAQQRSHFFPHGTSLSGPNSGANITAHQLADRKSHYRADHKPEHSSHPITICASIYVTGCTADTCAI